MDWHNVSVLYTWIFGIAFFITLIVSAESESEKGLKVSFVFFFIFLLLLTLLVGKAI